MRLFLLLSFVILSESLVISVFPKSSREFYGIEESAKFEPDRRNEDAALPSQSTVSFDTPDTEALKQFSCSFPSEEEGGRLTVSSCNFTFLPPADLSQIQPWMLGVGKNAYWLGGPTLDGSKSQSGGHAFIDASTFRQTDPVPYPQPVRAWLPTTVYPPTGPEGRCLKFAVTSSESAVRVLRVHLIQLYPLDPQVRRFYRSALNISPLNHVEELLKALPSKSIFNHSGNWREISFPVYIHDTQIESDWSNRYVTYSSAYPHGFLFEAEVDSAPGARGFVAVDDIEFSGGACTTECEFNYDFCDWFSEGGDFDWSIGRGTKKYQTGPLMDQASSANYPTGGGYAYTDSSSPRRLGQIARLGSPVLEVSNSSKTKCLTFWINMYGSGIGKLRVLQEKIGNKTAKPVSKAGSDDYEEIWQLSSSGPQNLWYQAQVTLASNEPFKVVFEATVGEPGLSDIAIDTVTIDDGPCPILPQNAVPSASPGLDCTFLENTCAWKIKASQLARLPGNFQPIFPVSDPLWASVGFSFVDGNPPGRQQASEQFNPYMAFRTFPTVPNSPARRGFLVSKTLNSVNEPMCFSFFALLSAIDEGKFGGLEVLLCPSSTGRLDICKPIWRVNNNQKKYWFYSQAQFTPIQNGSVLVISGIQGGGARGNVGIDDITVFKGSCPTLPKAATVTLLNCHFDDTLCGWTVGDLPTPSTSTTTEATSSLFTSATTTVDGTQSKASTTSVTTLSTTTLLSSSTTRSTPDPATVSSSMTRSTPDPAIVSSSTIRSNPEPANESSLTTRSIPDPGTMSSSSIRSTPDPDSSKAQTVMTSTVTPSLGVTTTTPQSTTAATITSSVTTTPESTTTTTLPSTLTSSFSVSNTTVTQDKDAMANKARTEEEVPSIDVRSGKPISNRRGKIMNRWRANSNPFGDGQARASVADWARKTPSTLTFNKPGVIQFSSNPYSAFFSYQPFQTDENGAYKGFNNGYAYIHSQQNKSFKEEKLIPIPSVKNATDVTNKQFNGLELRGRGWQIARPVEVSLGLRDHTFGIFNGGFAYFDGSNMTRLISPNARVIGKNGTCLEFYFAEIGPPGKKTLMVKRTKKSNIPETLWSISGGPSLPSHSAREPLWKFGQTWVEPESSASNHSDVIFFEGSSDKGGFAIDDVVLQARPKSDCEGIPTKVSTN